MCPHIQTYITQIFTYFILAYLFVLTENHMIVEKVFDSCENNTNYSFTKLF